MNLPRINWLQVGAAFMGVGVIVGAFGAHGLSGYLDGYSRSVYEKGVFYHLIHALGIVSVASMATAGVIKPLLAARICAVFTLGIVLFSGSLYLLAISQIKAFGAVTPFGGVSFILGWFSLARVAMRQVD
jgi:uncharacterized membrane protein YgdD (TMEM256/DUF423 family)